ncbi:hypothetical protein C2E23DRAFT_464732 [Lenzites betulinus]|nr:hypothetical protein C2E23DRAFT_464732 [Lenzites betulinus]
MDSLSKVDYLTSYLAAHYQPSCSHCRKTKRSHGVKLKRCTRCLDVLYCSKECQVEHWRVHKEMCRPAEKRGNLANRLRAYGVSTTAELAAAAVKWVETHNEAFCDLISATVVLNGGVQANLTASGRTLLILLDVGLCHKRDGNPAATFTLPQLHVESDADDVGPLYKDWPSIHKSAMEMFLSVPSPTFAGVMPVVFIILDTGVVLRHYWPIYKIFGRDSDNPDDETRVICEDICVMIHDTISNGLVLKTTEKRSLVPEIGELVRSEQTQWVWKQLLSWDRYALESGEAGVVRKSGLHPHEIWQKFRPFPEAPQSITNCPFLRRTDSGIWARVPSTV